MFRESAELLQASQSTLMEVICLVFYCVVNIQDVSPFLATVVYELVDRALSHLPKLGDLSIFLSQFISGGSKLIPLPLYLILQDGVLLLGLLQLV